MRRRAFPGHGQEIEDKYERAGNWLLATIYRNEKARDWCDLNGVRIQKASAEGIDSAGGFLAPPDLARAILDLREEYGVVRRRALIWPMASDNTALPRRPGGTGASFTAEGTAASETSAAIDRVELTAKKLTSLIRISSELEEDAIFQVVDFVANEIAWAFAKQEDSCAFIGDGTSTYGGMRGVTVIAGDGAHGNAKVSAASGHHFFGGATANALDTNDLGSLMAGVRSIAYPTAAWYCSHVAYAQTFCRLGGGAGGGYMETRMIDGVPTPCYLGYPIFMVESMATSTGSLANLPMIAFGSLYLGMIMGQRRNIVIRRSPERYFDQDEIGVLASERFDIIPHDMGDNTNFGAMAVLFGTT